MDVAHPYWAVLFLPLIALVVLIILSFYIKAKQMSSYAVRAQWKSLGIHIVDMKKIFPYIGLIVSLACAIIALLGPITKTRVPRPKSTIVLVLDISQSMGATDVAPSRIEAAKKAIENFVQHAPNNINIGLVTFDASAAGIVNPTTNHQSVIAALRNITLGDGTATGAGINEARRMIAKFNEEVQGGEGTPNAQIILLSDGKQTAPSTDVYGEGGAVLAARSALQDDIKIYPLAIGTAQGEIVLEGEHIAVPLDLKTLLIIANLSKGKVVSTSNEEGLEQAYTQLETIIGYEIKDYPHPFPWIMASFISLVISLFAGIFVNRRVF